MKSRIKSLLLVLTTCKRFCVELAKCERTSWAWWSFSAAKQMFCAVSPSDATKITKSRQEWILECIWEIFKTTSWPWWATLAILKRCFQGLMRTTSLHYPSTRFSKARNQTRFSVELLFWHLSLFLWTWYVACLVWTCRSHFKIAATSMLGSPSWAS